MPSVPPPLPNPLPLAGAPPPTAPRGQPDPEPRLSQPPGLAGEEGGLVRVERQATHVGHRVPIGVLPRGEGANREVDDGELLVRIVDGGRGLDSRVRRNDAGGIKIRGREA